MLTVGVESAGSDVPFEFVGQVARASALAETSHVEGGAAAARHGDCGDRRRRGVLVGVELVMVCR